MWIDNDDKPDFDTPFAELDPIAREDVMRRREDYEESLFEEIADYWKDYRLPWVVQGLLPAGALAILAGDPKAGKTCLATALALAVATGTFFAGMPTVQGGVLWLAGEESRFERYNILKESALADIATPLYTCYQHLPIDTEEGLGFICKWAAKVQANLVVVDPLYMATSGRSMALASAARRSLMPLKRTCAVHGFSALVLHHAKLPRAGEEDLRVAENAQLAACASMDWVLTWRHAWREQGAPSPRIVSLKCRGRGSFANQRLRFLSDGPLDFRPTEQSEAGPEAVRTGWMEQKLLDFLRSEGPARTVTMCANLHLTPGTLRNTVTTLRRKGLIHIVEVVDKERFWGLVDPPEPGSSPSALDVA